MGQDSWNECRKELLLRIKWEMFSLRSQRPRQSQILAQEAQSLRLEPSLLLIHPQQWAPYLSFQCLCSLTYKVETHKGLPAAQSN